MCIMSEGQNIYPVEIPAGCIWVKIVIPHVMGDGTFLWEYDDVFKEVHVNAENKELVGRIHANYVEIAAHLSKQRRATVKVKLDGEVTHTFKKGELQQC